MLARIRKSMEEKDQGFTLIELLVVMIIIGILAAIAIPVFLNQRAKARDTAVKADVSTVGKEIATYYVDGTGALGATGVALGTAANAGKYVITIGSKTIVAGEASDGVTVVETAGTDSTNWCVSLQHANGDQKVYNYSAAGGLAGGDCTP